MCLLEQPRNRYSQVDEVDKSMVDSLKESRQSIDDLFTDESFEVRAAFHFLNWTKLVVWLAWCVLGCCWGGLSAKQVPSK